MKLALGPKGLRPKRTLIKLVQSPSKTSVVIVRSPVFSFNGESTIDFGELEERKQTVLEDAELWRDRPGFIRINDPDVLIETQRPWDEDEEVSVEVEVNVSVELENPDYDEQLKNYKRFERDCKKADKKYTRELAEWEAKQEIVKNISSDELDQFIAWKKRKNK
jgi:hypothetical protein